MDQRMLIEMKAEEINEVLISYVTNKTNKKIKKDSMRIIMKDIINPITDEKKKIFSKLVIELE